MTYNAFLFLSFDFFSGLGEGYRVRLCSFGVMMFMFWHIRAVSACKHEPFDCTVDFPPVTAGGSAYQDVRPHGLLCPSHEGPAFVLGAV